MDKSTPRPWARIKQEIYSVELGPDHIPSIEELEANAALIVKVINLHDELVEALGAMRSYAIPGMNWTDEVGQLLLGLADKALAKAKE